MSVSFQIDVGSGRMTVLGMRNAAARVSDAKRRALSKIGPMALDAVKETVSASGYTLDDLADLDHPYARRHGRIRRGVLGGRYSRKPYLVHERSGQLKSGIRGSLKATAYEIRATGSHAGFVIGGTKNMLFRDFLIDTLNERALQRKMQVEIVRILGAAMRSQATVRGMRTHKSPSATEA